MVETVNKTFTRPGATDTAQETVGTHGASTSTMDIGQSEQLRRKYMHGFVRKQVDSSLFARGMPNLESAVLHQVITRMISVRPRLRSTVNDMPVWDTHHNLNCVLLTDHN